MMKINQEICTGCGACVDACPQFAIQLIAGKARVDDDLCINCESCIQDCPVDAIVPSDMPVVIEVEPAKIISIVENKPEKPGVIAPWISSVLLFVGRDLLPRLAEAAIAGLERRIFQPPNTYDNSHPQSIASTSNDYLPIKQSGRGRKNRGRIRMRNQR